MGTYPTDVLLTNNAVLATNYSRYGRSASRNEVQLRHNTKLNGHTCYILGGRWKGKGHILIKVIKTRFLCNFLYRSTHRAELLV